MLFSLINLLVFCCGFLSPSALCLGVGGGGSAYFDHLIILRRCTLFSHCSCLLGGRGGSAYFDHLIILRRCTLFSHCSSVGGGGGAHTLTILLYSEGALFSVTAAHCGAPFWAIEFIFFKRKKSRHASHCFECKSRESAQPASV